MTQQTKNTLANWVGIISLFIAFWVGTETIFARDAKVELYNVQHKEAIAKQGQDTINTFEMLQDQIKSSQREMQRNNALSDVNRQLNNLTIRKYQIKGLIRKHPGDNDLKEELREVNKDIDAARERLNTLLLGN